MAGKGNEMTIWNENGKQKVHKHYLKKMFLKEAYALHLENCINEDEKCSFSTFCNLQPKNVLMMGNSPSHQCKCQIHENLFLKLEAIGLTYDSSWWESVLCNTLPNSDCWKSSRILLQKLNSIKTRQIQAVDFQNDIKDPTKRVSQIDYAQSYQCEMQNEIISALWTRGSVNLFTRAVYNNSPTKTLAFGTNYKGKDKISSMLFIETL